MNRSNRLHCLLFGAALLPLPVLAQVITNSSFESDSLAGWTIGGTARVGTLQATHVSGGIPGGVPAGTWFAALSTGPGQVGTGTTARYAVPPTTRRTRYGGGGHGAAPIITLTAYPGGTDCGYG